jgi:hypothetical protein
MDPDPPLLHSERCSSPHHCRSCGKRGRFPPDTRSAAKKYAGKAHSRKHDPPGFEVSTGENSFTGLRVTGQLGCKHLSSTRRLTIPRLLTKRKIARFCHTQRRQQHFGNGMGESYGCGRESASRFNLTTGL